MPVVKGDLKPKVPAMVWIFTKPRTVIPAIFPKIFFAAETTTYI